MTARPSRVGSLYLPGYFALASTVCLVAVEVAAAVAAGEAVGSEAAAGAVRLGTVVLVVVKVGAEFGRRDAVFESVASDLQARNQPCLSYPASQMWWRWASPDLAPS